MSAITKLSPTVLALMLVGVGGALGYGAYMATKPPAEEAIVGGDVAVASKGEAFDLGDHLAAGKYTIFDYYADWCPPCRVLDPQLRRLAADRADVALRKVDIIDWTTDVVKQRGITALPYLELYDPEGNLVVKGDDAYAVIEKMFEIQIF
jgi:thiol-disulfide isomerase/thioredoxin